MLKGSSRLLVQVNRDFEAENTMEKRLRVFCAHLRNFSSLAVGSHLDVKSIAPWLPDTVGTRDNY